MATTAVKITTVGNSSGIVIPKELMSRLHVEKGDTLYITATSMGFELSPYDQLFAEEMEAGRKVMRKHRDVLKKLAE